MNFFEKVAAFSEKYDYPEARDAYINKNKPKRKGMFDSAVVIPTMIGTASAGAGMMYGAAKNSPSLVSKGIAIGGLIGTGLGALAGRANYKSVNKDYLAYKKDPSQYNAILTDKFNKERVPDLIDTENYMAEWAPRHPEFPISADKARQMYRAWGTGDQEDVALTAYEAEEYHNKDPYYRELYCNSEKKASELPDYVVKAASEVYANMPIKTAGAVLEAYDATDDPMAKLAFELIGQYIIKQANPLAMAGAAVRSAGVNVGIHGALLGTTLGMDAAKKGNTLEQGSQSVKPDEPKQEGVN